MLVASQVSKKKSWQTSRERVSVEATLAIQKRTVSRRLARIRDEHRDPDQPDKLLPMEKAAARVDVSWRTWQRWEAGEVLPYPRNLGRIADEFGFDVSEFYADDEDAARVKPIGPTPDPFGNPQLDRIEEKLDRLLAIAESVNGQRLLVLLQAEADQRARRSA